MLTPTPTADEMAAYIVENMAQTFYLHFREIVPYGTSVRFDVLGIKRWDREIRIWEVKSCRADFVSDKKWESYLPYCTHFAFAAPEGAISPDELPKEIGLVEFSVREVREGHPFLYAEYKRGCKRLRERPDDEYYIALLEGVIGRLVQERKPYEAAITQGFRELAQEVDRVRQEIRRERKKGSDK